MHSDGNPLINKIRYYSAFLMVALYFVIGLLFLFSDFGIHLFPDHRNQFAWVLIAYAGYRSYLAYKKYKTE